LPIGTALDSSPALEDAAKGKTNKEGRHVGLDFYDLLIEALKFQLLSIRFTFDCLLLLARVRARVSKNWCRKTGGGACWGRGVAEFFPIDTTPLTTDGVVYTDGKMLPPPAKEAI
jgi:hypothetical protein